MLELEDIPGRDFKPSIHALFEKIIHFNCPSKLCNNFILFREAIYFSKQKMFFIEIFEVTDNNLKILQKLWSIYENTLNVWNFRDAPHPQPPWTARHWNMCIYITSFLLSKEHPLWFTIIILNIKIEIIQKRNK